MKPELTLNQIFIVTPDETTELAFGAVGCVFIRAANEAEYKALLALKAECEKDAGWLYRDYQPESAEDHALLKFATSQLLVANFLQRLTRSEQPELRRFYHILNPPLPAHSLHIGNSENDRTSY